VVRSNASPHWSYLLSSPFVLVYAYRAVKPSLEPRLGRGYAYFRELRLAEVRRIHIPRTPGKKGKKDKKGPGIVTQILASSKRHQVGLWRLEEPKASPVLFCLSSNG
jgi:hypothetical protein